MFKKNNLKENNEERKRPQFVLMPFIGGVVSFVAAFLVCGSGALFVLPKLSGVALQKTDIAIMSALIIGVAALIGFFNIKSSLSVYRIDEKGIRQIFLGVTLRFIAWEDVKEVRFAVYGTKSWLYISKSCLDCYSYRELQKKDDVIKLLCYVKALSAVKEYYKGEIINFPKDKILV
ncbi:MAG: hypothetical protein LBQ27_03215 [Clostridiales bacterium]|nr:hypothetical protein [Clostridiales bacterium]